MFELNDDIFFDFFLAEKLHMTVQKLRTGEDGPISNWEWVMWGIYYGRKAQDQQLALAKERETMGRG